MKELPKMYRNTINKEINNNEKVFSTMDNSGDNNRDKDINLSVVNGNVNGKNNFTIEQKIANIFNSPNYIYKVDVVVVTDTESQKKRIVGRTKTNLITMDKEYIPINTIRDIYIDG